MKPIPAKSQSGRAIELGLALFIVSKRGRQVIFGQTGLLFANRQWVSTNTPGGNATSVSLPIAYKQWYKIVATGVVNSSDGDFKQTVAVLKDYNWSMTSFALRTSGSDRPAAFCITIGV